MKRFFSLLGLIMVMVLAVGCGGGETPAPVDQGQTDAGLKTGYAIISSVAKSMDAGAEDGLAQTDSTAIAVLVDADGVIVKCAIDGVQTKINFSTEGKLTTPIDTVVPTKIELGTDYGMNKASSLGKDWDGQIAAFIQYVEGKTVDEIKGIKLDEKTAPAEGEELRTTVTMSVGNYVTGVEQAVANATEIGAQQGDTLGLGIITNIAKSKDAAADAEGVAQAYSTYTFASFDADGKITGSIIDGSQCNVKFDMTGKITSDINGAMMSKNQLKEDYGMKKASSIQKEWYEEAAAYAGYAAGKTVEELNGIAVNEEGAPTDGELASSVTISVGNFNACFEKAFATAK